MAERPRLWRCVDASIVCGSATLVMGVVNVTPDSFSDGGMFLDTDAAIKHGMRLAEEGADILDIGGESTRPGSDPVPPDIERERVVPVIEVLLAETELPISIDTRTTEVAKAGLDAGAVIVNDVAAGADPGMFAAVQSARAGMVLMHMRGDPKTMQDEPVYEDVVRDVHDALADRLAAAEASGIGRDHLCVDPGIGFGKTLEHNLMLLRHVDALADLGVPVLVGPSRKRFIGAILDVDTDDRVEGTAGAVAWLASRRVDIVRVHDVKEIVRVVRIVDAIRDAP